MNHLEDLVDEVTKRVMVAIQKYPNDIPKILEDEQSKLSYATLGEDQPAINNYFCQLGYYKKDVNVADVLVITQINPYSIPRLANVMPINKDEELILDYISNNKTVYLLSNIIQEFGNKASNYFKRRYTQHVNDLKSLGIQIVDDSFFSIGNTRQEQVSKTQKKKKLITLKDIQSMSLNRNEIFEIDKGVIITDLAKDYLNDLNIQVKKRGIE
ncbi:hypothetical protein [Fundicoccus culcitae]|uniref:Ethanolamine utilization protein n=1 Tax=Fundicoccus culcitae TaxID=2969821 RepID=A0ABY5P3T8_9LACT|nr:hypothetical protein [Fundicoccus culcitae]UUX33334.1 hypothetical protein NRE15_10540 [Fundicoccus culcitae]